jgi:hypothetical protein
VSTYHVVVTREGVNWLADVPTVPGAHTWARNLVALDAAVREAVALADDLPDDAEADLDLVWAYRTGDAAVDAESATLRTERTRVAAAENAVATQSRTLVTSLVRQGYNVRDTARLAGIAQQRVSQIMRETTRQDPCAKPDEPARYPAKRARPYPPGSRSETVHAFASRLRPGWRSSTPPTAGRRSCSASPSHPTTATPHGDLPSAAPRRPSDG